MHAVLLARSVTFLVGLLVTVAAFPQGGVRLVLNNLELGRDFGDLSYGLGYDNDVTERTSFAVLGSFFVETRQMEFAYRSNFHLMDNDRASFYLGPNIAVRTGGVAATGVPLGFHMGVRGGLENFYADLFAGVRYRLGNKEVTDNERFTMDMLPGVMFQFGVHFGFGWD